MLGARPREDDTCRRWPGGTLLFALILVALPRPGTGAGALAVVKTTDGIGPFDEAIRAMVKVADGEVLVESLRADADRWEAVNRKLEKRPPSALVAVGPLALRVAARAGRPEPIVFMMVATPEDSVPETSRRVCGVTLRLPVALQIAEIRRILPGAASLGVLYDPSNPSSVRELEEARTAVLEHGFTIEAVPMAAAGELGDALRTVLARGVDALWLIADRTVTPRGDRQAFKFIAETSTKAGVPVVSYAAKHAQAGALFSLGPDYADVGTQAGELVNLVTRGRAPGDIGVRTARKARLSLNMKVARILGITFPAESVGRAHQVHE